jgi:hypothetical protein
MLDVRHHGHDCMNSRKRTARTLSYGLVEPRQLLEKLQADAEKLSATPHPYDVFNFIITAAVLAEWIKQHYETEYVDDPFWSPKKDGQGWAIPTVAEQWISDTTCFPNPANGIARHISNALEICCLTANASKHFHWRDRGRVEAIGSDPPIGNWYQYLFTSTKPDLYVTYKGENYGLQQIRGILIQFYSGLISHLEGLLPKRQ